MSKSLTRRTSIFLSLDEPNIYDCFKPHDYAILYKQQPGHRFREYILNSAAA